MSVNSWRKFFTESNLHGFSLILKSAHHPIERLLWITIIVTSIYFASNIYINELERYQTKSIALFLETDYRSWEYLSPGYTLCTDYVDPDRVDSIIEKISRRSKISKDDPKYDVYKKFIEVVTLTTYKNLHQYSQFLNESFLNELDMLEIAKEMREYILPEAPGTNLVMTEMGICFSSSYLHLLQNASEQIVTSISSQTDLCRSTLSLESCNLVVESLFQDSAQTSYTLLNYTQTLFIHNRDDVMNPTKSLTLNFAYETTIDVELIINAIVSSQKLHQLSPYQRKCIFEFESPLKYFKKYSTSLCMISCRIEYGMKLCGCIPYFYKINFIDHPLCTIEGMACLSNTKWSEMVSNYTFYDRECNCPPLCNSYEFKSTTISYETNSYLTPTIEINVKFPKKRVKRGVVYSADNLVVSIGGAFGLYLGASLISIVEFFFFALEILLGMLCNVCNILKLKLLS